jgi:hypothetical protein
VVVFFCAPSESFKTIVALLSAGPLPTTTPDTLVAAACEADEPLPDVPVQLEKRAATIIEKTASVACLCQFFIITYLNLEEPGILLSLRRSARSGTTVAARWVLRKSTVVTIALKSGRLAIFMFV